MSSETISSAIYGAPPDVTAARVRRPVVWAGGIVAVLGTLHLAITLALSARYVPGWLGGELWFADGGPRVLLPAQGAFWLTIGSFGLPLLVLGLLIVWLGRRGVTPPAFVAWMIGGWGTLAAAFLEPTPFLLTWVPAVILLVAARRDA